MSKANVETLFKTALALEKSAETLYRQLANMFSHEPDVELFWKRYANEENGHASYIEKIYANISTERRNEPASHLILSQLQSSVKRASKIKIENIKTLEDAYSLATELENTETNTIFEFILTNFSDEELAKSRGFIRVQLDNHINKLTTHFPAEFMSVGARQECLAKHDVKSKFRGLLSSFFSFQNLISFNDK